MKYRKRPVEVEAVRWTGHEDDLQKIFALIEKDEDGAFKLPATRGEKFPGIGFTPPLGELYIPTPEGVMTAKPGDYIIKGVKGEIYPCKPDIFESTYDPVIS